MIDQNSVTRALYYDEEFLYQYYELLKAIHQHVQPRFYLEVGVMNGVSISQADAATRCIGIDPAFEITVPLGPNVAVYPCTSEEFFKTNELNTQLAGHTIDLAFIDGMHLIEFALRDFINVEKYCDRNSVILLHDSMPVDELTAARERTTNFWSGDVWKLTLILERFRPDLLVKTISVHPTGLTVVGNLDSQSRVLEAGYDEICREYVDFPFCEYESFRRRTATLPYSRAGVEGLFAELARSGFYAFSGRAWNSENAHGLAGAQPLAGHGRCPPAVQSLEARLAEMEETLAILEVNHQREKESLENRLIERERDLQRITSTFGWRLLSLYGPIKHRFIKPVLQLLRFTSRNRPPR